MSVLNKSRARATAHGTQILDIRLRDLVRVKFYFELTQSIKFPE